jgi:hypothetical protein
MGFLEMTLRRGFWDYHKSMSEQEINASEDVVIVE